MKGFIKFLQIYIQHIHLPHGCQALLGDKGLSPINFRDILPEGFVHVAQYLCLFSIMIHNTFSMYQGYSIYISCNSISNNTFLHVLHDTQYQCPDSIIHNIYVSHPRCTLFMSGVHDTHELCLVYLILCGMNDTQYLCLVSIIYHI